MSYANGRLPASSLTSIPGGQLRKGAPAKSWLAMRYYISKKTNGQVWIRPTGPMSSYRTYAQQVILRQRHLNGTGALAAVPGFSNHGSATKAAVDLKTAEMQAEVRKYGHLFGWGIAGGKLPSDAPSESWHCVKANGFLNAKSRYWYALYRYQRAK